MLYIEIEKRQIRSIIDNFEKDYVNNKDYIIILREKGKKFRLSNTKSKVKVPYNERKDEK